MNIESLFSHTFIIHWKSIKFLSLTLLVTFCLAVALLIIIDSIYVAVDFMILLEKQSRKIRNVANTAPTLSIVTTPMNSKNFI